MVNKFFDENKHIGLILISFIIFVLIVIYYGHMKTSNNVTMLKNSVIKSTNNPPSYSTSQEDDCPEVDVFINKFKNSYKEGENQLALTNLVKDPTFIRLEKVALINNQCGASSASYLVNFYSHIKLMKKAEEYHKKVVKFADSGNLSAISNICISYDSLSTQQEKLQYCQVILNTDPNKIPQGTNFAALYEWSKYYFDNKEGDKLIQLCEKNRERDICFFSNLFPSVSTLADKFYKDKNFQQSLQLYTKIAEYDVAGFTQAQVADMYKNGEGTEINYQTSIYWYKKALEKNYNEKIRPEIINNMCVSYSNMHDYLTAFNCYKEAAVMNNPVSQVNLALMYQHGHGTLQDIKQAYAWITIAILQGLEDNIQQVRAENTRKLYIDYLRSQDSTGSDLKEAEALAQQYYKKYVMHEPISKDNENIKTKVRNLLDKLLS